MLDFSKHSEHFERMMSAKNLSENTKKSYRCDVGIFFGYFKDKLTIKHINSKEIIDWLLTYDTYNTRKSKHCAVKWFYDWVINQPHKFNHVPYGTREKNLPIVLSPDEVRRMFEVCTNKKHTVILALLYSCGLRVSELINLKWKHIDRSRMVINVIAGKGMKDRQVTLSPIMIQLLTIYYKEYKSIEYVLNGQTELQYTSRSVNEVLKQLAEKAGLNKRVYAHLIRHSNATHLLESGTDIHIIQKLLGHNNIKTTLNYTHISNTFISRVVTPLDSMMMTAK